MKNLFCRGRLVIHQPRTGFYDSDKLDVKVINNSDQKWAAKGRSPVKLSYHWLNENEKVVDFDGVRTPLPDGGVAAGASVVISAQVSQPALPGIYRLVLSLVREGMYWFDGAEEFHMTTAKVRFEAAVVGEGRGDEIANASLPRMTVGWWEPDDFPEVQSAAESTAPSHVGVARGSEYVCIKPYEKGRIFGFMHIPKTSGVAMRSILIKALDLKSFCDRPDRSIYTCLPDFVDVPFPEKTDYLAHVSLETLIKGCQGGQYITVFREASSRILSHWLFWRSHHRNMVAGTSTWGDRVIRARGKLLDVLLDPDLACQLDNVYLRMLVWPHSRIPNVGLINPKHDEELLERAFHRLKRFSYLDVVENPQFEANLREWLGTDDRYEQKNVTESMAKDLKVPLHREFTAETLDALEARSRLDRILWTAVAAARLPGVDLGRLTRDALIKNVARYSALMS